MTFMKLCLISEKIAALEKELKGSVKMNDKQQTVAKVKDDMQAKLKSLYVEVCTQYI